MTYSKAKQRNRLLFNRHLEQLELNKADYFKNFVLRDLLNLETERLMRYSNI